MALRLNPPQQAAVEHDQGPLLVLAGAGSGKTRVITARIARLLDRGVRPEQILAVSFTNKAAAEMGERMAQLVGHDVAGKLQLSTFHSFGVRFLQQENKRLGYDGHFVIYDQGDQMGLLRELLREDRTARGSRKLDSSAILSRISLWKNELRLPEEVPESDFEYDAVARAMYPRYEAALRAMHAVDFDDLVMLPTLLLQKHHDLQEKWQRRFRHILIDEFQDTNAAQMKLLRALVNPLRNVCVVGDDDQSIYGWRGADVNNILQFEQHFPGVRIVKLEDNYRSREQVLDVANAAIERSTRKRHDKRLRAARGPGDNVRMVVCEDPGDEARFVVSEIRDLANSQIPYRDMAILYRSNLQARLIEEELRAAGIPYRLFGGTQFFDRKEVKDAAAYLKAVVSPRDHISLRRVLNYPPRGVGNTTVQRLESFRLAHNLSFPEAVLQMDRIDGLPQAAQRGGRRLVDTLGAARERFKSGRQLTQSATQLLEDVGLKSFLLDSDDPMDRKRWENVSFLLRALERYEARPGDERPSLAQFLTRITLDNSSEEAQEATPNQVTLTTLHGSKGLEFPYVFLIGIVEGQLPHSRTTDPKITEAAPTDVEEERRLFYVGVTRAQDRLYLSRFKRRMLRGKVMPAAPSRFLDGLPEDAVEDYARETRPAMGTEDVADMAAQLLAQLRGPS